MRFQTIYGSRQSAHLCVAQCRYRRTTGATTLTLTGRQFRDPTRPVTSVATGAGRPDRFPHLRRTVVTGEQQLR